MSEPFIGQIMQVGFNYAPRGWAMCNGQQQSIAQNSALFALLGTTFGGDGQTTFNLPNLQGRTMVGVGQLPGGHNYTLGEAAGTENTTLTQNQMPTHAHSGPVTLTGTINANTTKATAQGPTAGSVLARSTDLNTTTGTGQPAIYAPAASSPVAVGGVNVAGTVTTGPAGGSQPFSILSPYLAMTTIIALQGIFPSRN